MIQLKRQRGARPGWGADLGEPAITFEVRNRGEPGLQDLGIVVGGLTYRWKVPTGLWTGEEGVFHLLEELPPRSGLLTAAARPWDAGSCRVAEDELRSVGRFFAGLRLGRLELRLRGARVNGTFRLERLRSQAGRWTGWRLTDSFSPLH